MTESTPALIALSLAAATAVAGLAARRNGDEARDVRLLLGFAAGFAGLALVLLSLADLL